VLRFINEGSPQKSSDDDDDEYSLDDDTKSKIEASYTNVCKCFPQLRILTWNDLLRFKNSNSIISWAYEP